MSKSLSAHVNITNPEQMGYPYLESIKSFANLCDEVIVVDGGSTDGSLEKIKEIPKVRIVEGCKWDYDFEWTILARNLQTGYEQCKGDWVFHFDVDYIFPEKNVKALRELIDKVDLPAIEIRKINFVLANECFEKDHYPLLLYKSNYKVLGYGIGINEDKKESLTFLNPVSKRGEKDGIYFGDIIRRSKVRLEISDIDIHCYDFTFMTREQIEEQRYRFDMALGRHKDISYMTTKEKCFNNFIGMMKERHKECKPVNLEFHSEFIRNKVKNIKEDQFGYNGFNLL